NHESRVPEFVKSFEERFGKPPGVHAALAYDGARLLFDALRRAQTWNGARLRDELAKTDNFESLTGPLSFASNQIVRRTVLLVRLNGTAIVVEKRYEPEEK